MGKSEAFQKFLDSVDPAYKPAARQTCNRLLVALQRVFTRNTRLKFEKLRPARLKKWISFQLDLWSSGLSKEAYGALTATFVEETFEDANREFDINEVRSAVEGSGPDAKERGLKISTVLLDFSAFPYIRHTADNIAAWIVTTIAKYGLTLADVLIIVPDGASNGKKACRKLHVPYEVCYAHNFQRVVEIAFGRGSTPSENPEMRIILRKHDRISQKFHQSTQCTKLLQKAQTDNGVRPTKVLNVTVNSKTRWGGVQDTVTRNNVLSDFIHLALTDAPTAAAPPSESDSQEVISRALEDSFGQLQLDGDGRRIPRPPAAAHGDVDEGDDNEEDEEDEEDGAGAMATGAGGAPSVTGGAAAPESDDVHEVDPRSLILSGQEKTSSLYIEGAMTKARDLTNRLQTSLGSSKSSVLATPDKMHQAMMAFNLSLRPTATIQVPRPGRARGADRQRVPVAWNDQQIPAAVKKYREVALREVTSRFPMSPEQCPSAVVCVAIIINPKQNNAAHFRTPTVLRSAMASYDFMFDEAVDIVAAREGSSMHGSPGQQRRQRRRTEPAGDSGLDDDMAQFEVPDGQPLNDGPNDNNEPESVDAVRARLNGEKAKFMTISPSMLEHAKIEGEFNVLRFYALYKQEFPVHYEIALCVYGAIMNEAHVERVFSFSSRTMSDRRTSLGASIFEAFVMIGFNYPELEITPELVEEVLQVCRHMPSSLPRRGTYAVFGLAQEYYQVDDITGDHDFEDPTEEREEDADEDEPEPAAAAAPAQGRGGAAGAVATPGGRHAGAAVGAAIVGAHATPPVDDHANHDQAVL